MKTFSELRDKVRAKQQGDDEDRAYAACLKIRELCRKFNGDLTEAIEGTKHPGIRFDVDTERRIKQAFGAAGALHSSATFYAEVLEK